MDEAELHTGRSQREAPNVLSGWTCPSKTCGYIIKDFVERKMKKKINPFKITIKPFTLIFWSAVVVILAVLGLLLKRNKTSPRKK